MNCRRGKGIGAPVGQAASGQAGPVFALQGYFPVGEEQVPRYGTESWAHTSLQTLGLWGEFWHGQRDVVHCAGLDLHGILDHHIAIRELLVVTPQPPPQSVFLLFFAFLGGRDAWASLGGDVQGLLPPPGDVWPSTLSTHRPQVTQFRCCVLSMAKLLHCVGTAWALRVHCVCTACALRAYCACRGWDTHPRIPVT